MNTLDALAIQKMEEIKIELNDFQRVFSLAALSSISEEEALKQIAIFTPRVAQREDIVLILNPLYNGYLE